MGTPSIRIECQIAFANLRDVLADLYDDTESARVVTDDAGIDASHVSFTTPATNNWHAILTEAEKQNRVQALIDVVRRAYEENQALNQAWDNYCHACADDSTLPLSSRVETMPLTPRLMDVDCPYRGLRPFEAEHAENYFGREAMVKKLVAKVGQASFVAVVGPSGCGKSSLVLAGLVTALQQDALPGSRGWLTAIFRPGEDPLCAMVSALPNLLSDEKTLVDCLTERRKMADSLLEGALPVKDLLAELRKQYPETPRLLLVVDQFEETFTLCSDEKTRKMFLATLVDTAATQWVTVLITLRAGFYGHVLAEESLGTLIDEGLVNVLPMTEEERRAAIEQPAHNAGRRFEEGLIERILDAVADEPGELPLLEFALTELWEHQTEDGLLTHDAYEQIGEVDGAIARRADQAFSSFAPDEQAEVRSIFTRLVRVARPEEDAKDTRRRIDLDELNPAAQVLVRPLADARLLVTDRNQDTNEVAVEVSHEALIRNWRRLQFWLNSDREFLLWRERLRTLAGNWIRSDRDEGALLRGAQLTEAEAWMDQREAEITEVEREFITDSLAVAEREIQEREAAHQTELELANALAAEESRARNRLRWLLVAVTAFSIMTIVGLITGWAIYSRSAGDRLLNQAKELKATCDDVEGAIALFNAAARADPGLKLDLEAEVADTRRHCATALVRAGQSLAAGGNYEGAGAKFDEALALDPPPDTLIYVWIPAGEFTMDPADTDKLAIDNDTPSPTIHRDGFWIMRTEVTNSEYKRFVHEVDCTEPEDKEDCVEPENSRWDQQEYANQPVGDVTWRQAQSYAEWVGGQLPTEADWEKACQGTGGGPYPWGDSKPTSALLNFGDSQVGTWKDVGFYPPGANGLYDMAGNVWEWTSSEWSTENPYHVIRGGSLHFLDTGERVRCDYRIYPDPKVEPDPDLQKSGYIGFRVLIPGP